MRRSVAVLAIVAVLTLGVASRAFVTAQEGAPAAGIELAPGVYAEVFSGVPTGRAPDHTLYLARFTFLPGSEIFPHGHPGTTSLSVVSGTFGWTLVEGTAYVIRGAAAGGTEQEELTEPGTEVLLEPGDAISYEDDVIHTARGASDEPAVIHGTFDLTTGEPLIMTAEEMAAMDATPAP